MRSIHIHILNDNMTPGATTKNTLCSSNKMLFRGDERSGPLRPLGSSSQFSLTKGEIVFSRSRFPPKQLTCSCKPLNSVMTRRKELSVNKTVIRHPMPHHIWCPGLYAGYSSQHARGFNTNTAESSFKAEQFLVSLG